MTLTFTVLTPDKCFLFLRITQRTISKNGVFFALFQNECYYTISVQLPYSKDLDQNLCHGRLHPCGQSVQTTATANHTRLPEPVDSIKPVEGGSDPAHGCSCQRRFCHGYCWSCLSGRIFTGHRYTLSRSTIHNPLIIIPKRLRSL